MPRHFFKGVNIHYEVNGKGSAVVLLHGFLESIWMWKDVSPTLSGKHRVITVDLPGHGKSECIGYVHSMDEMAQCVKSVLGELGVRRVTLVGHSMGGYVALAFADLFPDNVRKLVLYQSTALADSTAKKMDRSRTIELIKKNHKSFVRQSIPMLFRPKHRTQFKKQIAELKLEALKTSKQGIIAALAGIRDRPNREILLNFSPYPIVFIAGEKDQKIPLCEIVQQAKQSENIELRVIKGSGHMSYIEAQQDFVDHLRSVLEH